MPCILYLSTGLLAGCGDTQQTVGELKVCLGEQDMPRAHRQALAGFDYEMSALLATGLNRKFIAIWLKKPNPNEIESTDIDYIPISKGFCDIQPSIPGQDAITGFDHLVLTAPYYGTRFELIPSDINLDFKTWSDGKIAVRSNTVAHIVLDRYELPWTMKQSSTDIIRSINDGEVKAALIWGPELANSEYAPSESFQPPSVLRWNQHIAVRKSDAHLLMSLNRLLAQPSFKRDVMDLLSRYRIPRHPPFATTYALSDLKEL